MILRQPLFIWLITFLVFLSFNIRANNYAPKLYYLVDSLELSSLPQNERNLVDSCLSIYHNSSDLVAQHSIISHIVSMSEETSVWSKYNHFVYSELKDVSQLKLPITKINKLITLYAKSLEIKAYECKLNGSGYNALSFYEEAGQIYLKQKSIEDYVSIINRIGLLNDNLGRVEEAMENYKTCLEIQIKNGDEENIGDTYNNMGLLKDRQGDLKNAINYFQKAIFFKKKYEDTEGLATSFNNLAGAYSDLGKLDSALVYYDLSLNILKKIDNEWNMATLLNNMALVYEKQGKIPMTLDILHQSLKLRKELGDIAGEATSLNNIAHLYQSQGDYDLAQEYFLESLEKRISLGFQNDVANSYNNLGALYEKQKKNDSALIWYKLSMKTYKQVNNKQGISIVENNLGSYYEGIKVYAEASKHYLNSLKLSEEIDADYDQARTLSNLCSLYIVLEDYAKAQEFGEKGFIIAQQIGAPEIIKSMSNNLYLIYKNSGHAKLALQMFETYISMRDSLFNIDNNKAIAQQQAQYIYETAKAIDDFEHQKQAELSKAEHDKQIALEKEQQSRQRMIIYFSLLGLCTVVMFLFIIYKRLQLTKKQRNVIEEQKLIVEDQKKEVIKQHKELEEVHKEISDSIKYAERLQKAILPSFEDFENSLTKSFVLFQPKDNVSGDFYWMQKLDKSTLFAAADCTGHGVPGAMVSVVCCNALNRVVNEFKTYQPKDILFQTRELVIETFAKSGKDIKDGMDIALCSISNNKLIYSGANNPLWLVRKRELLTEDQLNQRGTYVNDSFGLVEYKANKQPIGFYENMKEFREEEITLFSEDSIYIFTDGYADQFGGAKNKKLMYKPFKKLLLELQELKMEDQKESLLKFFADWRGINEQIDDVCVIGVKMSSTTSSS